MMLPEELREKLKGPVVAMTTPFNRDLSLDVKGLQDLTDLYAENGVPTVIVTGSTGEFFSMTEDERKVAIETVINQANGRMTVVAGCAHSGTQMAIDMVKFAEKAGADGAMVTPPYYNHSGWKGIVEHFRRVATETGLGIIIYFSGAVLPKVQNAIANPRLMLDLAEIPHMSGFKDSSGNYPFYRDASLLLEGRVAVMGSAGMGYYLWGQMFGSPCFLTGLGNIWPKHEVDFYRDIQDGNLDRPLRFVKEVDLPYLEAMRPRDDLHYHAGVKALLDMEGLPGGRVRSPLIDWPEKDRKTLRERMVAIGLMNAESSARGAS